MSLASTRETICKKLSEQFDSLTQPATSAQAATRRQISEVKSQLKNLEFSADATLDSAISDLDDEVQDSVPAGDPEDVEEAVDFINDCDYLSGDDTLNNPIALMNGAVDSTINKTRELVSSVADSVPDFGVGQLISEIQEKLSGALEGLPSLPEALDITAIVQGADQIINCVAGRCGPDYSSRVSDMITDLQSIYDDYTLDDDPLSETWGQLDLDQIYSDAELTAEKITKMDKVVTSVNKSKTDALSGISNLNSSLKTASRSVQGIF